MRLESPLGLRMLDHAPDFLPTVYGGIWMEIESLGEPDSMAYLLFISADESRHLPLAKRIFLYGDLIREEGTIIRAEQTELDSRLLEACKKVVIRLFLDRIPYVTVEPDFSQRSVVYLVGRSDTLIDFMVKDIDGTRYIQYENGAPVRDPEWAETAILIRVKEFHRLSGLERTFTLLNRRRYSVLLAPGLNRLVTTRAKLSNYAEWLRGLPSEWQDEAKLAYGYMVTELF